MEMCGLVLKVIFLWVVACGITAMRIPQEQTDTMMVLHADNNDKSPGFQFNMGVLPYPFRRSLASIASVEIGPGAIKSDPVSYPPNYLQSRLKRLLYLKKKNEEDNKDVNAT